MDMTIQVSGVANIAEMMEDADDDERFQSLQFLVI